MKLESQVCSLELAQKLKELGVKQESLWEWYIKGDESFVTGGDASIHFEIEGFTCSCSAYTVAELGEGLPQVVVFPDPVDVPENENTQRLRESPEGRILLEEMSYKGLLSTGKPNGWFVYYKGYDILGSPIMIGAKQIGKSETEADARAKMRIYLLENKLITV
tara:strand:+ start:182 stop:670 length:489 start_codon:yes stop_codon:yes gene_type:complete